MIIIKADHVKEVSELVYQTNFANLFAPPGLFKALAFSTGLKTDGIVKWLDKMDLKLADKTVYINAVSTETAQQEWYSGAKIQEIGVGEAVSRSIALPGFIRKPGYMDGGVSENPLVSVWNTQPCDLLCIRLAQVVRPAPKDRLEELGYAWDFKADQHYKQIIADHPHRVYTLHCILPAISSTDFGINKAQKKNIWQGGFLSAYHAIENSLGDFIATAERPIAICLAGSAIRSIAHIGVLQALATAYPDKEWYGISGTSGGAIMAALIAGWKNG